MQEGRSLGDIKKIFKLEGLLMTVKYALPDVMGFLLKKRGAEQAEKDLRDIGEIIANRMLMVWTPASPNPVKVLKEIKKKFFKKTKQIKARVLEKFKKAPKKIIIYDKDCPVCPTEKREEIILSEIHYCTAISGFIEALLKKLIEKKRTPYKNVSCKTIASVGSGAKRCEMLIELEY